MPTDTRTLLIDTIQFVQKITRDLVEGFPAEHVLVRPCPTDNPVIWNVGHLASVNDWFASLIDGRAAEFPRAWQGVVGYMSTPGASAEGYPSYEDLLASLWRGHARLLEAVKRQSAEELGLPTQADSHGLAPTRADAAARAAWHEGWHGGQIAGIRKSLGLKNVM
jgi:hypothetical protein